MGGSNAQPKTALAGQDARPTHVLAAAWGNGKCRGRASLRIPQGGEPFSFVQDKQSRTAAPPLLTRANLKIRPYLVRDG
jgi:hypothetical protein